MRLSDEQFYTSELDEAFPGLSGIGTVYRTQGAEAAEAQLGKAVRENARTADFFRIWEAKPDGFRLLMDQEIKDAAFEADEALAGRAVSCGYRYQFPEGKIDWFANPTENDYKEWTWQLSRHPVWKCLGLRYRETGDERYAKCFVDQLMSWIAQAECPEPCIGYATLCWRTIEAGIRIHNWAYAFFACLHSPYFTDHVLASFVKSIWEHGWRLSGFCTSNNWLIMEMTGLAQIGMLFPYLKNAGRWREQAIGRLTDELEEQFYPDGFQIELTTGYQSIHICYYPCVFETARAMGYELPGELMTRFARVFEMYMKLCQPDGYTPGLNDGGPMCVADMLQFAQHYFPERADFRWFATGGKEGRRPEDISVILPYSGMAVMRTGWDAKAVYCFFESAPFGAGHQHEDKLNIIMHAYGKNVLPDPGTYHYDDSEIRKWIIDTRSHNCGMVDGQSQNRRDGYAWHKGDQYKKSDLRASLSPAADVAEGIYDEGFGAERTDVVHTRKVIFFKQEAQPFAVVIDRMIARDGKAHRLSIHYQMNEGDYTQAGRQLVSDLGDGVRMHLFSSDAQEVIVGQTEPCWMGWKARYGIGGMEVAHQPAPCVQVAAEGESYRFVTVLCPTDHAEAAITAVEASGDVNETAVTLRFADGSERILNEHDFATQEV